MPGLAESSARLQSRCWSGLGSHLMLTVEGSASKLMLLATVSPLESSRLRRYSGFVSVGSHPSFLAFSIGSQHDGFLLQSWQESASSRRMHTTVL